MSLHPNASPTANYQDPLLGIMINIGRDCGLTFDFIADNCVVSYVLDGYDHPVTMRSPQELAAYLTGFDARGKIHRAKVQADQRQAMIEAADLETRETVDALVRHLNLFPTNPLNAGAIDKVLKRFPGARRLLVDTHIAYKGYLIKWITDPNMDSGGEYLIEGTISDET